MVLGNVVRIVVGIYGALQIIFGAVLLASPFIILSMFPSAEINTVHIVAFASLMIAIGFVFLLGVFRLREV